jgi:hypothetical protein
MKPTEQVISRALAETLKAAGVPQQSYFIWYETGVYPRKYPEDSQWPAAFTLGELIPVLEGLYMYRVEIWTPFPGEYQCCRHNGPTPQEAVGNFLLARWLLMKEPNDEVTE